MNEQEFRDAIAALETPKDPPPPDSWGRHRWELHRHAAADKPREFLRWSTIRATMFVANAPYIKSEWEALRNSSCERDNSSDVPQRWVGAAMEDVNNFGAPERLPFAPATSGNMVHQAYHLLQWETATGQRADKIGTIVEFGGGYGAMCAVTRQLGFTGKYVLYDNPEFLLLQEYYLSNVGLHAMYRTVYDQGLFPAPPDNVDLLIALYSLSEAPPKLRCRFFDAVQPRFALLLHQESWGGENTIAVFDKFCSDRPQYDWSFIPYHAIAGHRYIIGTLKNGEL